MDVDCHTGINMPGGNHGHVTLIMKDTLYVTLAMGTPRGYLYDPGSSLTIATNDTVVHC